MASSLWGVNSPEAVKLWSKKLFHESVGQTQVSPLIGTSSDSVIQFLTDTQKSEGDRIRFTLRKLLSGNGVQGDGELEGNEEALATYTDDLTIDQLRHAVVSAGKMSEQRVSFEVREECRLGLQDWWKERIETSIANQLVGYTAQSDTRYTGNNATTAPSTSGSVTRLIVGGGESAETSLSATTTHAIKLSDLDKAAAIAKAQSPRIRPIVVEGKKLWVCFLHPYAIKQLRADSSTTGNFFDIQKAQLQGGKISDNPILTGGEFIYNGTIVYEWPYLPTSVGASDNTLYRRGAFCGAQSVIFGVGQGGRPEKMTWVEDKFDYGNRLGVSAGMIFGATKAVFNSIDFGVITLAGYAPAP
jgi:N4-gp56 family major capsid protein